MELAAASTKLLEYRYHITLAIAVALVLSLMLYAAPRLLNILTYFWPLLASTAALLVTMIGFGGVANLTADQRHPHGQKAGQGLLDYVAGPPPQLHY